MARGSAFCCNIRLIPILLFLPALFLTACWPTGPVIPATSTPTTAPTKTAQATRAQTPALEVEIRPTATFELPALPVESSAAAWQRLDSTGGGGQTGIAAHPGNPDIIYMASDNGGLFKTENGGDSWISVSSNLGAYRLGFVTLDPLNPDVIYVTASNDYNLGLKGGSSGEIHRSLNGGSTWQFVTDAMGFQNSFPNQRAIVIPFDPAQPDRFDRDHDKLSDVILVGAWTGPADPPVGGIWRSDDEGKTFKHLAIEDQNVTALRAFAANPNILFATTYGGEIHRSDDGGLHWRDISGDMPLAHPSDLAVHPTEADILYVTCRPCEASQPPVWKTTNGGEQWQAASAGLDSTQIGEFPKLLIDRSNPDKLYVTTARAAYHYAGVYQSDDGGQTWQLMPGRLVLPDGRPYYWYQFDHILTLEQAVDGRLFASGGAAWRYPAGDKLNGRDEWEPATIGIGNILVNALAIDPLDSDVLYEGLADLGTYKSIDQGLTFYPLLGSGWPVTTDNFVWNGPYFSNYKNCQLVCSATCRAEGTISSGGTNDLAVSAQDSKIIYSAFGSGSGGSQYGGVNKSINGGMTWQPLGYQLQQGFALNPDTCLPYGFRHLALDPTDDQILFAAMEVPATGGVLYRTDDGGLTWSEVYSTSRFITGLDVSARDPKRVIFTTSAEVYVSEQGGVVNSWHLLTLPEAPQIKTVKLSPHQAEVYVLGTNDQGIYYTADGGRTWVNNPLQGFFEQRLSQDSAQFLEAEVATALNPKAYVGKNISAIAFDPVLPDVFYVAGTQYTRASVGVAKVAQAGQTWERLPLAGLSHRNVFDLAVDSKGEYLYAGTFNGTYRLKLR